MADIKNQVYVEVQKGRTVLPMELNRGGKVIQVNEPIAELSNGVLDQKTLETLRKIVP